MGCSDAVDGNDEVQLFQTLQEVQIDLIQQEAIGDKTDPEASLGQLLQKGGEVGIAKRFSAGELDMDPRVPGRDLFHSLQGEVFGEVDDLRFPDFAMSTLQGASRREHHIDDAGGWARSLDSPGFASTQQPMVAESIQAYAAAL
ncbi:MAG: hypothetical protein A2284_04555 [Deltaproteobacteria bacterium RIFOXYA12_FULL_61_11]|nr:MAG: hypothetical protein A2284_04555 [Deltaproteobacteria bacterium RIFOXYA12_FULL_61_11]